MKFLMKILMFFSIILLGCSSAQVQSDYLISFNQHPKAVKYLVFLEQRTDSLFRLKDSIDYLEPINLSSLKIAELTNSVPVSIKLNNDGKLLRAGVVVEDTAGFYSVMGVSVILKKPVIPDKPTQVSITILR